MDKLASQMLDKLQGWVEENPDLVKTTLLTSGIGALAAAAMTGKEGDRERTSSRVKRRIKNALLGALATGGSVGLLHYGINNLANSKLKNAPTPDEKFNQAAKEVGVNTGDVLMHPLSLLGAGSIGAAKGLKRSWDLTNIHAQRALAALKDRGVALFGDVPKEDNGKLAVKLRRASHMLKDKAHADNIRKFVAELDVAPVNTATLSAEGTQKDVVDALKKIVTDTNAKTKASDKLTQLLALHAGDAAATAELTELQNLLKADTDTAKAALTNLQDVVKGHGDSLSELIKKVPNEPHFAKEDFMRSLVRAGFDNPAGEQLNTWEKFLNKAKGISRRNWRAAAGAALAAGGLAGTGAIIKGFSED
jgi:hypothetical protein